MILEIITIICFLGIIMYLSFKESKSDSKELYSHGYTS